LILNWSEPFEAFENGLWRRQPDCFLAGQIDGPLLLRPRRPARMLGIGFHPYGAAKLLALPNARVKWPIHARGSSISSPCT
jgi:hypothetical protein